MPLPVSPNPSPPVTPTKIQSPSPYKSWKVRRSPRGRINPYPPTPIKASLVKAGIQGDVIYRWRHKDTGRRYVGSSLKTEAGNTFFKRLGNYTHHLNDPDKKRRQHIIHALRRSPDKFTLKILDHRPNISEKDLLQLEEDYQDLYDTRNRSHGYNHTRPTTELHRSKEAAKRRLFVEEDLPSRPPSERKAAKIAKEKINDISMQR